MQYFVKGGRLQNKTHSTLKLCIFTASFLHFFFLISVGFPFPSFILILLYKNNAPPNLSFSTIGVLVMQSGQTRVLYWLTMKLDFGSNKELRYMHMHIIRVSFERLKLPRMAYIISC